MQTKDMFAEAGDPLLDHLTKMSKKVKNVVGYDCLSICSFKNSYAFIKLNGD